MDINLDLIRRTSDIPRFVMQYEVDSRAINFTILNNGIAYDLTSKTVTLCMEKPDGELIYNAVSVPVGTAGKCNITLTSQAQAAAGVAKCWIKIVDGASVTYSPQFDLEIREVTDFSGAVESTSEFTALEDALATVTAYDARLAAAESDIDDLETEDGQNVKITGDQTVAGVKTFSSSPIVPTPTTDMQAGTKKYTDDHAALSLLTGTVHGVAITTGSGNLTPTASSGTITTASATYSYYRIGKLLTYQIACAITTKGTGGGLLILTGLPIQYPVRTSGDGYNENGGSMIRGYSSGNAVVVTKYDSSTVIADSTTVHITMVGLTA